ncbi:MAG: PHB depolymerase family esterase [Patescibacteria group bacterium]
MTIRKIILAFVVIFIVLTVFRAFKNSDPVKVPSPQTNPLPKINPNVNIEPVISNSFTLGPGTYKFSLAHDGRTRNYEVHAPPNYNGATPQPAVIYLHGGGGSIEAARKDGLDRSADQFGFILIVPAGTGPLPNRLLTWNGGKTNNENCCGYAAENNVDDVGFIAKMLAEVETKFNLDQKRIYATGISNGGLMSYRLACDLSDKIAAVAAVAAAGTPDNCANPRPVPVMHIHGTADPCALFAGGASNGCFGAKTHNMLSAERMVASWLQNNGCSTVKTNGYQRGAASCVVYNQCRAGSAVEFCSITGGGHTWPAGSQYLPARIVGPVSNDISFEQIWEFFKQHPLR